MKYLYTLKNAEINDICEKTRVFLSRNGESHEDIIKVVFTLEELLLRCQKHFGENKKIELNHYKRFGVYRVVVDIKGERYDAKDDATDLDYLNDEIMKHVSTYENLGTNYKYVYGTNRFEIFSLKRKKTSIYNMIGGSLTLSILLAISLGIITSRLLDNSTLLLIVKEYIEPILSKLTGIINGLMAPLMMFSILSSICLIGDITNFTTIGSRVLKRYIGLIFIMIMITVIIANAVFPVISLDFSHSFTSNELYMLLINIIPTNTLLPFVENETIKIVIIALFGGYCILASSKDLTSLKDLSNDMNHLFAKMMKVASKIIPIIVFLNIYKSILTNQNSVDGLADAAKILAINMMAVILFTSIQLTYMAITKKVSIVEFLKSISKPVVVALSTASTTMASVENKKANVEKLKIDPKLASFWGSLTHALFNPSLVFPIVVASFYAAYYSHASITITQLIIIMILTIQLSIASPKVQGGIVAVFTILISQLGFNEDCIGALVTANIVLMYLQSGFSVIIRDCELMNLYKSGKINM